MLKRILGISCTTLLIAYALAVWYFEKTFSYIMIISIICALVTCVVSLKFKQGRPSLLFGLLCAVIALLRVVFIDLGSIKDFIDMMKEPLSAAGLVLTILVSALFYVWISAPDSIGLFNFFATVGWKKLPMRVVDRDTLVKLGRKTHAFISDGIISKENTLAHTTYINGSGRVIALNDDTALVSKFLQYAVEMHNTDAYTFHVATALPDMYITDEGRYESVDKELLYSKVKGKKDCSVKIYSVTFRSDASEKEVLVAISFTTYQKDFTLASLLTELPVSTSISTELKPSVAIDLYKQYTGELKELTSKNYQTSVRKTNSNFYITSEELESLSEDQWVRIKDHVKLLCIVTSDVNYPKESVVVTRDYTVLDLLSISYSEDADIVVDDTSILKLPSLFNKVRQLHMNEVAFEQLNAILTYGLYSLLLFGTVCQDAMPLIITLCPFIAFTRFVVLPLFCAYSRLRPLQKVYKWQVVIACALVPVVAALLPQFSEWMNTSLHLRSMFNIIIFEMCALLILFVTKHRASIALYPYVLCMIVAPFIIAYVPNNLGLVSLFIKVSIVTALICVCSLILLYESILVMTFIKIERLPKWLRKSL